MLIDIIKSIKYIDIIFSILIVVIDLVQISHSPNSLINKSGTLWVSKHTEAKVIGDKLKPFYN